MFLTIVKCQTIAIVLGYILDLIIGDPHWLYHPVQLIGRLITFFEKLLLKKDDKDEAKYIKGAVLAVLVLFVTGVVVILFLAVFYNISIAAGCIAETIMCYQILAVKSLRVESMKVYTALKQEGIEQARIAVSMIVGRDTMQLDNHGVIRAAVETVAENTSDGVVAPLFYMLFFGAPGGFMYKNDKYMYFGRFAAKMDDVFNYIPARIGGCLMVVAAGAAQICEKLKGTDKIHYSIKNAWKIYKRDKKKHSSPNAAQTEAACAGALMVALSGDNYYFGRLVKKPQIGDDIRELETEDIKRSNLLLYITAFLMVVMVSVIRLVLLLQVIF